MRSAMMSSSACMAHIPKLSAVLSVPGAASQAVSAISSARGTNTVGLARSARYSATSSIDDMNHPAVAIHFQGRAARDPFHRALHADDAWNPELAREDRAVRQHPTVLDDESGDEEEHRPPA